MNSEWLPIESAPRDGSLILFWRKRYQSLGLGAYKDGHIYTGGFVMSPSAMPREWEDVATHWMPTPSSPHLSGGSQ